MARKTVKKIETVGLEILIPFNGMYKGDRSNVELTGTVQGWLNAGLARLTEAVDHGTHPTGQGAALTDDSGSVAFGAGDSGQASDEPSEGFGSGSYGSAEGFDQN